MDKNLQLFMYVFYRPLNDHTKRHKRLHTYNVYIMPNGCLFQENSLIFPAFFVVKKVSSVIIISPSRNLMEISELFYWKHLLAVLKLLLATTRHVMIDYEISQWFSFNSLTYLFPLLSGTGCLTKRKHIRVSSFMQ